MRVTIDLQATVGQSTGFGRYVGNIRAALPAVAPDGVTFTDITRVHANLRTPTRILWDQVGLPLAAVRSWPDALFVPAFSVPLIWPKKILAASHDLIGLIFPEYFSATARWYWHDLLPRSLRHADHIVTISESSKRDLVRLLNIPSDRITVTPLAVEPSFAPVTDGEKIARARRAYNLPRSYCIAVGTIEPRKNYPFLVDAFSVSKREDHDLVIVGKRGWDVANLDQRIRQLHLADRVRVLEYVDEADLASLYSAATALLFPSRYEGFGLPILEAMACGTPVVASTASSIPEVGGDAVLYADPNDHDAWKLQISRIISDATLRSNLRQRGLARAATFTWRRTAQRTMDALLRVHHV